MLAVVSENKVQCKEKMISFHVHNTVTNKSIKLKREHIVHSLFQIVYLKLLAVVSRVVVAYLLRAESNKPRIKDIYQFVTSTLLSRP